MRFLKAEAIGIEAAGYTIVLQPGHYIWVKPGPGSAETILSSALIFTSERLAAVERQGGALKRAPGRRRADLPGPDARCRRHISALSGRRACRELQAAFVPKVS
jgi:hypothetical protein